MHDLNRVPIMDERAVLRAVGRMARELVERNAGTDDLIMVGVQRRGSQLAELLVREIEKAEGDRIASGHLDITLYRDDLRAIGPRPVIGTTKLPAGGIDDKAVVIVDDVLYTGRTVRAALNELMDFGRPSRIYLCVLVDRGGRELPIQPDVVGRHVEVMGDQTVEVLVPELDGRLGVDLVTLPKEAA
ncbi:MAG: bifunctional pyr operon transcriptional regulator/uracil phosphoribosyltransferase PyrR [Gemmatimonadetes bacterium]|nr:bifunctional pyr operon transcriptional regulator/uracil phosphoribosyltransferase PyrR [Gemmatimonadota bacterium]